MRRDIRDRWVAALRSGAYEQGRKRLRTSNDQYCCLGVLCEIAVETGVIPPPVQQEVGYSDRPYKYGMETSNGWNSSTTGLPDIVATWAGLGPQGMHVRIPHKEAEESFNLAYLNDNGSTFEEIADLIEEYL